MATTVDAPSRQEPSGAARPLDSVFSPKGVAVVGVTTTPGTVPYDIFHNILVSGYRGGVYPVAPGKRAVCDVPAYRYVVDIEDPVDLAVIVFPAGVVDRALKQCGQMGIRAAIVISAGFREVGPEGVRREEQLRETCAEYGISMIGPNCLGVINTDPQVALNASFARKMPHAGRIAFLSQSGALCTAVLDYAREKEIGFSKFISFGNKAGVSEIELLEYLHQDDATDVILLYLEELREGRRLAEVAQRITRGDDPKPILAIKAGRTPQGADAAVSHTGSLAGEDAVCDAVFQEAGIIRVASIEELFNAAILYAYQPLPERNRLAIVTNAGGPGVMATDAAVRCGLSVPRLCESTRARLKKALPATANTKNPVDVIGDARADRYMAAIQAVLDDPNVDQALVILTPQSMTDIDAIARGVCQIHESATKPIACSFMGATDVVSGIRLLQKAHVPHYTLPEWACRAMADVERIRLWRQQPPDEPKKGSGRSGPIRAKRRALTGTMRSIVGWSGRSGKSEPTPSSRAAAVLAEAEAGYLPEDQALEVLSAYGLPVPPCQLCTAGDQAVAFARQVGYPVVLRVVSPQIVHKSEAKALAMNLADARAVLEAYDRLLGQAAAVPGAEIRGVLVRPMIPAGHEVILGAKRDPAFGPVLMFGLGGIYVELFEDVTFALAPIAPVAAGRMIRRTKAHRLLGGLRGSEPADVDGIQECLVRLGELIADHDRILELDVNPLIVGPAEVGSAVADVRIRLQA